MDLLKKWEGPKFRLPLAVGQGEVAQVLVNEPICATKSRKIRNSSATMMAAHFLFNMETPKLNLSGNRVLVTGCAGFIGFHLASRLLAEGVDVVGIDNLSDYYDPRWKLARLEILKNSSSFSFAKLDIADASTMQSLFEADRFQAVFHLASQAGVRHSIDHPYEYIEGNLKGTVHILENCRRSGVEHFLFASTSSVYGLDQSPFRENGGGDHPASLYAATKRSGELMAHSYAHLFGLPSTCLRFFTVYGPWGRPDMAPFLFASSLEQGAALRLFAEGRMRRDFTYIDDVIEAVWRTASRPPLRHASAPADRGVSSAPWRALNVGGERPVEVRVFLDLLAQQLGATPDIEHFPAPAGDVWETCADAQRLEDLTGFHPKISLEEGVARFAEWWRARPRF